MKKSVVLFLKDEDGNRHLEEKLKQYPEYSSPDVARLILDYNEECVKKIIDYCDKNNIKYDRNILGAVFAKLTEEQIVQISSGGLIEVVVNEPAFRGASSH